MNSRPTSIHVCPADSIAVAEDGGGTARGLAGPVRGVVVGQVVEFELAFAHLRLHVVKALIRVARPCSPPGCGSTRRDRGHAP